MNKLLLYSLSLFFLAQATEITKKEGFFVSQKLDSAPLFKNNEKFKELKNNEYFKVHDYDVNTILHVLNHEDTIKNSKEYNQIQSHLANGEIAKANVNEHGVKGTVAGFWLSKFAVHAAAQAAYALAAGITSLVYPPAAPIVYCSLQLTFASTIEFVSNIVASRKPLASDAVIGPV